MHDVLAGEVSGELVALINEHGDYARRRVSGETIEPACSPAGAAAWWSTAQEVDLGHVGDIDEVDPAAVVALLDAGRIPVDLLDRPRPRASRASRLNVNADAAAAALAVALGALAVRAHRCSRPVPGLAPPRLPGPRTLIPWNSRRCCPR